MSSQHCEAARAVGLSEEKVRAIKAELGDVEILELTYITCTYDMHAVMAAVDQASRS